MGIERGVVDDARVGTNEEALRRRCIPDASGSVTACGDYAASVGAEGSAPDLISETAKRVPRAAQYARAVLPSLQVTIRSPSGLNASRTRGVAVY